MALRQNDEQLGMTDFNFHCPDFRYDFGDCCQPGCIIYKCTSTTSDWKVYHIGLNDPATYSLTLNGTGAEYGTMSDFGSTAPTTSAFTAGPNYNTNGETYVAYIYAGGY